jgi:eukaryotic-like serine/threonine-protein kinase
MAEHAGLQDLKSDVSPAWSRAAHHQLSLSGDGLFQSRERVHCLNQFKEAKSTIDEAQSRNFDSAHIHFLRYQLAFLQNDAGGMAQQVMWSAGKPGVEEALLANEADTAAYFGRLTEAREFSRRAIASAERTDQKEVAASYEAIAALREGLSGNATQVKQRATAALEVSKGLQPQYGAMLALAFSCGGVQGRKTRG